MEGTLRHFVQSVRPLTDATFVIRIDRHGFRALPGQHVTLGPHRSATNREYSLYSSPEAPYLEFLIRARPGSETACALQRAQPGDEVDLAGPYGDFLIERPADPGRRYLFVATGAGIAPFHCFVRSYPSLDYRLLHGVATLADRYEREAYAPGRYVACVSREDGGEYRGRVTDYLREHPVETDRLCYLCGHSAMVARVYDQLREQGVPSDNLLTETFF